MPKRVGFFKYDKIVIIQYLIEGIIKDLLMFSVSDSTFPKSHKL